MKTIRTKILSLLLALVTILSLLPTAAFAASKTGSGIQITQNQAYWSTRLLANGTPYSYRPPLVDGKLVYCMDSGLGYHYATPSYLNSFTWTSGTGADADAVLQSAVTNSGLSEMDAATVENVKWMMTYLNDCKASNVGQLFMAVQTYVWDHQSYKGEPGGDGDAGGYANADTYDLYLSLIDWLLEQKAQEDAEFQRQIEEFTAQGKSASIVEDESAKWAVYAISSNRKNQSFFNYYHLRGRLKGGKTMLLSNQQKYILEILKEFKYLRVRQLHALVQAHYRTQGIKIDERRMEIMLRQMRTGTNYVWLRGDVVSYGDRRIDPRLLEALDVMLELTKAQPGFYSKDGLHEPFLLRFTGNGKGAGYLFSVAWLDAATHIATVPRMKGERIIWISESGSFGEIDLPRHHFFAARQKDGTHRFFGSNEPEKI